MLFTDGLPLRFTSIQRQVLVKTAKSILADEEIELLFSDPNEVNNLKLLLILLENTASDVTFGSIQDGFKNVFRILVLESWRADVSQQTFNSMALKTMKAGCGPIHN